ncbi:MAG: preprotein translocase subunit SecG [Verrucomicrobia bacterium]|nr:preprotein translocase subunit SecG [Verrucomicrobiota bacterium]
MMFLFYFTLFLFVLLCAVICVTVLVQESKSLGLGASFGGDPGESLFGTSTAAVLKKFTGWLGIVFMIVCVILSLWSSSLAKGPSTSLPTTIEEAAE